MVKTFISALITVLIMGAVGASIPVAIASLVTYVASNYMVSEAIRRIRDKIMPEWIEWTAYAFVIAGTILLAAGFRFMNAWVLLAAGGAYIIAFIFVKIHQYLEEKK